MNRTTSTQPKPATTQEPRDIEAELAQLRRQHDLILHAIGDGIHGVDADGKILFENPAAARLLGRAPGELLGQPAHHAKPGGAECPIDATFRDGRARRVCGDVFRRKDGTGFPVDYAVTPMENERGKMTGALVVFRDVTEAKELEAQSRRARRIESIGKLAGGVAQDIGDALSPILEVVALFKRKMRDPDDLELLEIVETGARRGTEMVRQMRSFTDGIDGQRVIIHPSQLLRGIAKEADETSPGSIVVSAATPAELPTLLGDPAELHQALHILCANARNAMPEGQKLTLTATHAHIDAGDFIVIEVADSGAGTSPEVVGRMCHPFFDIGKAAKSARIGLTTAHAIAKSHGGFILVENEPERGKIFRIHLPRHPSELTHTAP